MQIKITIFFSSSYYYLRIQTHTHKKKTTSKSNRTRKQPTNKAPQTSVPKPERFHTSGSVGLKKAQQVLHKHSTCNQMSLQCLKIFILSLLICLSEVLQGVDTQSYQHKPTICFGFISGREPTNILLS